MPEVTHSTEVAVPLDTVWDFVRDMDHWAPFLTGYQRHERHDDERSTWHLKGDVGVLSREVELEVVITEWVDRERVTFTLRGINEDVEGGGVFELRPAGGEAASADAPEPANEHRPGFFRRLLDALARWLFRRQHGEVQRTLPAAPPAAGNAVLAFTLRMDAGGPMGPMVNAMLGPALLPATEDLAEKIAAHLEREHPVG